MAANAVLVEQPVSVNPNDPSAENAASNAEPNEDEDAAGSSQNGMAVCQTDRFGFCGGQQYTDPSRYVRIISLFSSSLCHYVTLNND